MKRIVGVKGDTVLLKNSIISKRNATPIYNSLGHR